MTDEGSGTGDRHMSQRRNRSLIAGCLVVMALSVIAPAAGASPARRPLASPTISLAPTVGPPGTRTRAAGGGFGLSERVRLSFDGAKFALTTTDTSGSFSKPVTIPAS